MTAADKDYADLLARLDIKPGNPMCQELIEELGEATWRH